MQAPQKSSSVETKPYFEKMRFSLATASVIAYLVLFLVLPAFFSFTGMPILAVIPVIIIAWLYGVRAGLIASLLCFPVNALMMKVSGFSVFDTMLNSGGGIAGHLGFIFIALVVGRLSNLQVRLRGELLARQAVEQELRSHRENLEQMVADKVRDLHESRERFRAIAENSPDAIIITDAAGVNIPKAYNLLLRKHQHCWFVRNNLLLQIAVS